MVRPVRRWILVAVAVSSCAGAPRSDRLLIGGILHLPEGSRAGAVAVAEGRIVAIVGAGEEKRWRRQTGEVVELGGAHVYPGFTEGHGHFSSLGAALEHVDLAGTASFPEVVERVRAAAREVPAGDWVLGRGWDQNDWPVKAFPHHRELSAAVPDRPVVLRRVDGHAILVNGRALAAAGIDRTTVDPPGGRIQRDAQGEPTGILIDAACDSVERLIPAPSKATRERRALLAGQRLASLGFTEIHDAGTSRDELAVFRILAREGRLPIRIYVMLDGGDDALLDAEFAAGTSLRADGMLAVRAVKLYADGALGSRGAWLSEPYTDEPTTVGLEVTDEARLAAVIRKAATAGFQPCIHAIGDAAVSRALDLYAHELGDAARLVRPRIEHAQIVRLADVARFASIGVIAAVQPTHCTSDMPWAPQRLGEARIAWAYRWRTLLAAGARLNLGSDVPVEDADPRLGVWAAVTRRQPTGTPSGGWNAAEALTATEAADGYTLWNAYSAFEEDWRGAIRPTFAADFTVFDRDLSACRPGEILEARVLRTIVAGRDAFVAEGGS